MDRTTLTVSHSGSPGYPIIGVEVKQSAQNYIIPCSYDNTAVSLKIINYSTNALAFTLTFTAANFIRAASYFETTDYLMIGFNDYKARLFLDT